MRKHLSLLLATTLLLSATGCGLVAGAGEDKSLQATCERTAAARTAHASALADDGGTKSALTGRNLIAVLDAACAPYDK